MKKKIFGKFSIFCGGGTFGAHGGGRASPVGGSVRSNLLRMCMGASVSNCGYDICNRCLQGGPTSWHPTSILTKKLHFGVSAIFGNLCRATLEEIVRSVRRNMLINCMRTEREKKLGSISLTVARRGVREVGMSFDDFRTLNFSSDFLGSKVQKSRATHRSFPQGRNVNGGYLGDNLGHARSLVTIRLD